MAIYDLLALTLDPRLQPREHMNDALVREYAEAMGRGDIFPAIAVVQNSEHAWVTDGWHRVAAAKSLGLAEIEAHVSQGTFDDALDQSLTVNRDHGMRRTNVDVQNAIRRALVTPRWVERSDSWLARHIGCSDKTVTAQRERLEAISEIPTCSKLLTDDGRWYPRERAKDSRKHPMNTDKPTPVVMPPLTDKSRQAVAARTAAISRLSNKGASAQEIADSLGLPKKTVHALVYRHKIPVGWRRSTKTAIVERVERIRELADAGANTAQIADAVGLVEGSVQALVRQHGITVRATQVQGRTRRPQANRIIERMVMDADHLTADVNLIDWQSVNEGEVADWITSLRSSERRLRAFIKQLDQFTKGRHHGTQDNAAARTDGGRSETSPVQDPAGAVHRDAGAERLSA